MATQMLLMRSSESTSTILTPLKFAVFIPSNMHAIWQRSSFCVVNNIVKLEGKYSLESTDPRESEIRTPPQPLPYLMPIPPNTLFL